MALTLIKVHLKVNLMPRCLRLLQVLLLLLQVLLLLLLHSRLHLVRVLILRPKRPKRHAIAFWLYTTKQWPTPNAILPTCVFNKLILNVKMTRHSDYLMTPSHAQPSTRAICKQNELSMLIWLSVWCTHLLPMSILCSTCPRPSVQRFRLDYTCLGVLL